MSTLTKEERIQMSKKIIAVPEENKSAEFVKQQILAQKAQFEKDDALNASLQAPYNDVINAYQLEYNYIDGNLRTELTEGLVLAAAKQEKDNGFFIADPDQPLPSLPDGVWKFFNPAGFTYAIGKNRLETYDPEPLGEEPILTNINDLITEIEAISIPTRATGDECTPGTPNDTIGPNAEIQDLIQQLKDEVQLWEDSLNAQASSIVLPEPNSASREVENQAAFDDTQDAIAVIDAWQAVQDFDTSVTATTCAAFNSLNYSGSCSDPTYTDQVTCELNGETWTGALQDSKLSPTQLQNIKDEVVARTAFIVTRKSQLDGHFGTVTHG